MKSEFDLIEEIKSILGKPSPRVHIGIGDDAAVLELPKRRLITTVDRLVEEVHFDLAYSSPESVGHKALAVSLSDVAAMGGTPLYALVSLGIPKKMTTGFILKMYRGMQQLARSTKVDIVGGNVTRSLKGLVIDTTVIGESNLRVLSRKGAKAGDWIGVTHSLGEASAGLATLQRWGEKAVKKYPALVSAQLCPFPRLKAGKILSEFPGVHCAIDLSDGLSSGLHQLADASKVGFQLEQSALPISPQVISAAKELHRDLWDWVLHGGEDYEILFSAAPETFTKMIPIFKKQNYPIFKLGTVVAKKLGVTIQNEKGKWNEIPDRGWKHF